MKRFSFLGGIFLSCLTVFLCLGVAEIMVRIFAPQPLMPVITMADEDLAYRLRPGVDGRHRNPQVGFDVAIRINAQGLRDTPHLYSKPWNTLRVLGIGDSYAFGWGVESEETYLKVFEKDLNSYYRLLEKKGEHLPFVETINAGVAGFGTAQELRFLKRDLYRYHPDWIILCYNGWDKQDNLVYQSYTLDKEGNLKEHKPGLHAKERYSRLMQAIPFYRFFAEHSELLSFFRTRIALLLQNARYEEFKNRKKAELTKGDIPPSSSPPPNGQNKPVKEEPSYADRLEEALFKELARFTKEQSARLVVLSFSAEDSKHINTLARRYHFYSLPLPQLYDRGQRENFLVGDGHFSPAGHRLVSESLEQFFLSRK